MNLYNLNVLITMKSYLVMILGLVWSSTRDTAGLLSLSVFLAASAGRRHFRSSSRDLYIWWGASWVSYRHLGDSN